MGDFVSPLLRFSDLLSLRRPLLLALVDDRMGDFASSFSLVGWLSDGSSLVAAVSDVTPLEVI